MNTLGISKELVSKISTYIHDNQPALFWDYRDELSNENIETLLGEDGLFNFEEELLSCNIDYMLDLKRESVKEYILTFREELESELGEEFVDSDEFEDGFIELFEDDISVDLNSDELIRMHQEEIFFYNTGLYVEAPIDKESIERSIYEIKEMLSIDTNELDEKLNELIINLFYGGELVIYFKSDITDILKMKESDMKSIRFSDNVSIAVIDTNGGSGFDVTIHHEFALPFKFENVFFEKSIKYNYTYAVCGLVEDWCSGTVYELVDIESDKEISNDLRASLDDDRKLSEKWKNTGECTFGDMDYTRHGEKSYSNEYPCGNRCLKCGTFWID